MANNTAYQDALCREIAARSSRISLQMQMFTTDCCLGNKHAADMTKVKIEEELQLYYTAVENYSRAIGA